MAKPQKVKLKKSAWVGIIITCLALILFVILLIPTERESIYKTFSTNENFTEDHIIDKVSYNRFRRIAEKSGDERVYVLYCTAETATESIDVINDIAVEKGIEKIYWLDAADTKIDETDEKDEFADYLRTIIGRDVNNTPLVTRRYVREAYLGTTLDMFVFQNGQFIARYYDIDTELTSSSSDGATSKSVEYILRNYLYK